MRVLKNSLVCVFALAVSGIVTAQQPTQPMVVVQAAGAVTAAPAQPVTSPAPSDAAIAAAIKVLEQTKARLEKARSATSRDSASAGRGEREREPAARPKQPATSEHVSSTAFDPIAMTDDTRRTSSEANGFVANLGAE